MHLTDEQLNEYLDHESLEIALIEMHLTSCADCAARLTALRSLFSEIESLPEVELSHSIAARISPSLSRSASLPRFLTLTVALQAVLTVIAVILATPFVMRLTSPVLTLLRLPSFANILLHIQSNWMTWLDTWPAFRLPALPDVPFLDTSSISVMTAFAAISLLWLVGNGLLLRNRTK